MDEQLGQASRSRRPSGREAKRAARTARSASFVPYITRKVPYYEVLSTEGLELMERNADTILEEIGIDFRDDAESLQVLKQAGADVRGERVHVPHDRQQLRAAGVHTARPQPGALRDHRR